MILYLETYKAEKTRQDILYNMICQLVELEGHAFYLLDHCNVIIRRKQHNIRVIYNIIYNIIYII